MSAGVGTKPQALPAQTRPMRRRNPRKRAATPIGAYDLETTPIADGTPDVRYFTAYDGQTLRSHPIISNADLAAIVMEMVREAAPGTRFVAWNANRFDGRFIATALIEAYPDLVIRPYLTKSKALRGFHVERENGTARPDRLYFLDGIAMTGMIGTPLRSFLEMYAPDFPKQSLDLEYVIFNPHDTLHVAYAERDAIGLWHAMNAVEGIVDDLTGLPLQPTIGNLGIKYFQREMPKEKIVWSPPAAVRKAVYGSLLRGGYCWAARQYVGKVDKYDLNQAYAAAMRETRLPCGPITEVSRYHAKYAGMYEIDLSRSTVSTVPFFIRRSEDGRPVFTHGSHVRGWVTGNEYSLLHDHGWTITVVRGWIWEDSFDMADMVDNLERLRMTCEGGPKGPTGTMVKAIGNNAYGKSLEQLDGVEYVMSATRPDGYTAYMPEDDTMEYVWYKQGEDMAKQYHQPQIGAFITASVRCKVLRAAWSNPTAFLYADTDCVVFLHGTPLDIETHPSRYGLWKVEALGVVYMIIGKKVYCNLESREIHAKGLHTRELTIADMWRWWSGKPPEQVQTQLQPFWRIANDATMFESRSRSGTDVRRLKSVTLTENRRFYATIDYDAGSVV